MLILTRKVGQAIQIATDVRVHVLGVRGMTVRIGVDAPPDVAVWRDEVFDNMTEADRADPPAWRKAT